MALMFGDSESVHAGEKAAQPMDVVIEPEIQAAIRLRSDCVQSSGVGCLAANVKLTISLSRGIDDRADGLVYSDDGVRSASVQGLCSGFVRKARCHGVVVAGLEISSRPGPLRCFDDHVDPDS